MTLRHPRYTKIKMLAVPNISKNLFIYHKSLLLSSLFIATLAFPITGCNQVIRARTNDNIDEANQTQSSRSHDLDQVLNLASDSIHKCYSEKNLTECDRLREIESTLMEWCGQGDRNACEMSSFVAALELHEQLNN